MEVNTLHQHPPINSFIIFTLYDGTRPLLEQVLELMQMHPKERLRRVILTASWFIAINVGQFSLRIP